MSGYPWTPEEEEHLSSLCGDMPWFMVVTEMKGQARRRGWRKRTESAMKAHAEDIGLSLYSCGEWITTAYIAEMLKLKRKIVLKWINSHELYAKRVGRPFFVSRTHLRIFAKKNPQYFAGLPESDLLQLLSNEQLASELAEMPPVRLRNISPVVRVLTGQRFPTMISAAKAYRVSYRAIQWAIQTGGTAAGSQWRRA